MISTNKDIYLQVGGFTLKLIFKLKTEASKKIKADILSYYRPFIVAKKVKKIDYSVELVEPDQQEDVNIKKFIKSGSPNVIRLYTIHTQKRSFTKLYSEDKKRKKISLLFPVIFNEVEFILRHIFYALLRDSHSFFMHLAAVAQNGEANIFLGDSGAGKSTLVSLLKKQMIPICDDRGLIKREDGSYYLYQSPYIEKNSHPKSSGRVPIRKIYFLKKSTSFKIVKIPPTHVELLLKNVSRQILINNNNKDIFNFTMNYSDRFYYLFFSHKDKNLAKKLATCDK